MNGIPTTEEEFRIWMVGKIGEIHATTAEIKGSIDLVNATQKTSAAELRGSVELANYRIDAVEKAAKSAKTWENAKMLVLLLLQGLGHIVR